MLESFLVKASDASPDCRRARDRLLVDFADWPAGPGGTKRQWIEFLTLLGVVDGLRPVVGRVKESGAGWSWDNLVRGGDAKEALDRDWCTEASSAATFGYPYTVYRRRGEAWRLSGQIEHGELPESAKEAFHELAVRHLEAHNAEYLTFDVGRFERPLRSWDQQTLPTPLATFLRSKAWVAVGTHEEPVFRKASECWGSRTRQGRPPRFLERMLDTVAGLVEGSEELADLVFGEALGFRDWHSADTAPERLQALAIVAPSPHGARSPGFSQRIPSRLARSLEHEHRAPPWPGPCRKPRRQVGDAWQRCRNGPNDDRHPGRTVVRGQDPVVRRACAARHRRSLKREGGRTAERDRRLHAPPTRRGRSTPVGRRQAFRTQN